MKRLIILALFSVILLGCAFGQEVDIIYIQDTGTIAWTDDNLIDEIPYPDGAVVQYEVVLCLKGADIEDSANYEYLGMAEVEEYAFDIGAYGWAEYLVGVRVVVNGYAGDYAWSNDAAVCEAGITFTLCPEGLTPDKITGLGVR